MIISSFLAKACSYSHASNGADLINNHISVPTKNTNLQKKEHTRKKPTKLSLTSETPHQNTNTPYFCIFKVSAETAYFFSRVVGECRTFTMQPSCLSILNNSVCLLTFPNIFFLQVLLLYSSRLRKNCHSCVITPAKWQSFFS